MLIVARLATRDVSVHGITTVRLVGAPEEIDRRFVERWSPVLEAAADPSIDLTIEFRDHIETGDLRNFGAQPFAYDDSGFYGLIDRGTREVLTRLDPSSDDAGMRILCRSGSGSIPYLVEFLVIAFIRAGWAPLHGSAVEFGGRGVVTMGWPKSGKTSALLAFMNRGAQFVGDEWILVRHNRVLGLPLKLSLSEWQLPLVPGVVADRRQRWTFRTVHLLANLGTLLTRVTAERARTQKLVAKAKPILSRQLSLSVRPEVVFPGRVTTFATSADVIFLLIAQADDEVVIREADPTDVATQMTMANLFEQRNLMALGQAHRHAFPTRTDGVLDDLLVGQREVIARELGDKRVYRVYHRYGSPPDRLFAAMAPYCG